MHRANVNAECPPKAPLPQSGFVHGFSYLNSNASPWIEDIIDEDEFMEAMIASFAGDENPLVNSIIKMVG